MKSLLRQFCYSESGANSIEYALIASLISIVAMVSMVSIGGSVNIYLTNVLNAFTR